MLFPSRYQYPLSRQFEGVFFGVALGELWGQWTQEFFHVHGSALSGRDFNLNALFCGGSSRSSPISSSFVPGLRVTLASTQSFLQFRGLNLEDWLTDSLSPLAVKSSDILFATVPVALFFHENLPRLAQNLEQVAQCWEILTVDEDTACSTRSSGLITILALGYVLSQVLTRKFSGREIIPQTITYLGEETSLTSRLQTLNELLKNRASLATAVQELSGFSQKTVTLRQGGAGGQTQDVALEIALSLALYCWLSTPEFFNLSLMRAAQTQFQPALTCGITGILSGAYNSRLGISPVRSGTIKKLYPHLTAMGEKLPLKWGISAEAELQLMATGLFALWSGVDHWEPTAMTTRDLSRISSPNLKRPFLM